MLYDKMYKCMYRTTEYGFPNSLALKMVFHESSSITKASFSSDASFGNHNCLDSWVVDNLLRVHEITDSVPCHNISKTYNMGTSKLHHVDHFSVVCLSICLTFNVLVCFSRQHTFLEMHHLYYF